ncbi:MAG: hypothetical protein ACKO6B_01945, partial [Planctomycetia bacterium]
PAVPLKDHERRHVVASLLATPGEGTPAASSGGAVAAAPFAADPARVEEGRAAFAAVGCANCHAIKGSDGKVIEPGSRPMPLEQLAAVDAGCLATAPRRGAPHYFADEPQRAAVTAAIRWLASPAAASEPPRERSIDRMLTALNCYACHQRDGRGGTVPAVVVMDDDDEPILKDAARDALFASSVQELGDEGRLPPTLTSVGDKLSAGFLREVLI